MHRERHKRTGLNWLRASVLGANDGIVSTGSLVLGVAAATPTRTAIAVAGIAGLVAGALSMAVGEYASVSSQRDAENSDIAKEKEELRTSPKAELTELAMIYKKRGLSDDLAKQVATELMEHDALGAHLRDELDITETTLARPEQAALASAISFTSGSILPLLVILAVPAGWRIFSAGFVSILTLGLLGAWSANLGAAPLRPALIRVVGGGLIALAVSVGIGHLVGAVV